MIWNWLLTVFGINNPSGPWYSFYSGIGANFGEVAIIGVVWKKVNCHAKGCLRVGLHPVSGTHFITCRKHHPVHDGNAPATAEQIAQAHDDATT